MVSVYSNGIPYTTPHSARRNSPPVYRDINDHDAEVLRSRNIPPHIAETAGMRSITAAETGEYGHRALSGLLIPSHNTQGEVDRNQLRPHDPPIDPKTGKPRKYLWPRGSRQSIYVPPQCLETLRDIDAPLIMTEAPLKALAIVAALEAAGIDGLVVAAVAGVYGWRSGDMPLSDHGDIPMKRKQGEQITYRRQVYIAFDSDAATNPNVTRARWEYSQYLRRKKARVLWIDIPTAGDSGKQGIDDALAAGLSLETMIANATPAVDIMPPIDPEVSELDQLRTENDALRQHVSTLTAVITTPHVPAKTKALILRAHTTAKAKAARGEVDQDGGAHISAGDISNDWREATPKGGTTPATNKDGTVPIMKRGAVMKAAREARELGLIDFTAYKVRKTHANGNGYWDTEVIMTPVASIAAALEPIATYQPTEMTPRPYNKQERCPHCGEIHERTVIRQTICGSEDDPGCGAIIKEQTVTLPVPPASDADATPEEREELDRQTTAAAPEEFTSTIDVEVKDVGISAPSPDPTYSMSTMNVEVSPKPAPDQGNRPLEPMPMCVHGSCMNRVTGDATRCRDHTLLSPEEYDRRYGATVDRAEVPA